MPTQRAVHVPVPRPESTPASKPEPVLDAEKLEVHALALELQALASTLVPPNRRVLQDQVERASLSVVLVV